MLGLLGCLDLPTDGVIRVGGEDVTQMDDAGRTMLRGRAIGFVFQQFHLIPFLGAAANVETALLYREMRATERREHVSHHSTALVSRHEPITGRCSSPVVSNNGWRWLGPS